MTTRMLIDAAHPEETRVVVVKGSRLEEFDMESATRKQLRGNIYLAKVTRVEPSLQAAFVDYGGNRHGFLAFSDIHPDYYQIPIADREALLQQQAAIQTAQDRVDEEADESDDASEADEDADPGDNAELDAGTEDDEGESEDETAPAEPETSEELKVVLSIRGGRAVIGVQRPSSDPHIEAFDDADLFGLADQFPAVVARARARWEEEPMHPAYERPAPPPRQRNRNRRQQAATAPSEAEAVEPEQPQTETLRLF